MWQVADSKQQNGSFKIAIGKAKQKLLAKRLDTYMDSPGIYPTDIMSIVNDAWDCSFAVVKSNQTAIADRGWNPLNYCLLDDNDIKCTMTDSVSRQYHMMLKSTNISNMVSAPMNGQISASTSEQSLPLLSQSTISDLTDTGNVGKITKKIQMNYDPKYLTKVLPNSLCTVGANLNFSVGRSAEVARRLLHESDLSEAREANQKLAKQGKIARQKLENAKKLTAMLNFNHIGCKVGEDSLKLRLEMAKKKKDIDDAIQQKKDKMTNERKRKYDEIQKELSNGLPLHQLSITQLKSLCLHKKNKDDKVSISKLKRDELVSLWMSWKSRSDPVDISTSSQVGVALVSHTSVEVDRNEEECHNINCNENATVRDYVIL